MMPEYKEQKKILVLGAGFGGIAAVRTLGRFMKTHPDVARQYDIVLVNDRDFHIYTPGLYEVATALREDVDPWSLKKTAAIPIQDLVAGLPIQFIQDRVEKIDCDHMTVTLKDGGTLSAQYLLFAVGAAANTFGIPGVLEHGLILKTFEDALKIRTAVTEALKKKENAHIVVAGGGATGVELCGELVGLTRTISRRYHKQERPVFTLIEATPRLLPGMPDLVAALAKKRLESLGVRLMLEHAVTHTEPYKVFTKTSSGDEVGVDFDFFIWSGGIKSHPLLERILVPKDKKGRCMVDPDLTVHGKEKLFAVGDLTCFMNPENNQPLPAVAWAALGEGKVAAKNICASIQGRGLTHYHPPKHPPFIVPISGKWAIAHVMGITFAGLPAFVLRLLKDLRYFLFVLPPPKALRFFLFSTLAYFKND